VFWLLGIRAAVFLAAGDGYRPHLGAGRRLPPYDGRTLAGGRSHRLWRSGHRLVDNVLRPILIGQDTKILDYIVLVSTLGGLATFGANGFVIGPVIAAMFLALWTVFSATR
jgi:hypothetical protein